MTEEENKELELRVKKLFLQSRKTPELSSKIRIKSILDRSLHELALRDLLVLSAHLIIAMLALLQMYFKLFTNNPQRSNKL